MYRDWKFGTLVYPVLRFQAKRNPNKNSAKCIITFEVNVKDEVHFEAQVVETLTEIIKNIKDSIE